MISSSFSAHVQRQYSRIRRGCHLCRHRSFTIVGACAPTEISYSTDDRFLRHVETTVHDIARQFQTIYGGLDIVSQAQHQNLYSSIPLEERETVGIVRHLHKRLRVLKENGVCRRCWLQKQYCICHELQPIPLPSFIHRIFLLTHHKEIGMSIDTMKIILCAYPEACRLVVAGLSRQTTMTELLVAMKKPSTLLLYPYDESTKTFASLTQEKEDPPPENAATQFDIVLVDATWEQARRIVRRYLASNANAATWIQLLPASLVALPDAGRQLRPHPIDVREIATAQALLLLFQEMGVGLLRDHSSVHATSDALLHYQHIAAEAAGRQIGNFKRVVA